LIKECFETILGLGVIMKTQA